MQKTFPNVVVSNYAAEMTTIPPNGVVSSQQEQSSVPAALTSATLQAAVTASHGEVVTGNMVTRSAQTPRVPRGWSPRRLRALAQPAIAL